MTCGSVDDGKSTLVGRLLYDSKCCYDDQLTALAAREARSHGTTGGISISRCWSTACKAEREQGITIDVAFRYFATAGAVRCRRHAGP